MPVSSSVIGFISIHAPTRGATATSFVQPETPKDFNPRSHEGSDKKERVITDEVLNFNPRSHEGSDMYQSKIRHIAIDFNPRSHEGSDMYQSKIRHIAIDFNPRSHEGSDLSVNRPLFRQ